jgi:transcriptional regulator with XRE-family HTH domain
VASGNRKDPKRVEVSPLWAGDLDPHGEPWMWGGTGVSPHPGVVFDKWKVPRSGEPPGSGPEHVSEGLRMLDEESPIGQRIAYWRKRRGKTQQVLAGLVGRSAVWLSKVERGERVMDSITMLLDLARVLKVEPWDLLPKPGLPPNGGAPLDLPGGLHAVSRAVLLDDSPDREPPSIARLCADVDHVQTLRDSGSYEERIAVLPELLVAAKAAAALDVPGGWWCLTRAYLMASSLGRNLGEPTLMWTAVDRAVPAAERSGDRLLVAYARRRRAFAMLREGWLDQAGGLCSDAADAIAPTDATPVQGWSVWGSLQLTQAVITGRAHDEGGAWRVLRDARVAAERVGPGRNDYWEAFGPANVGAHEILVALGAGDAVEVLRIADRLDVEELPPAKRAEVCIDVALAHSLRRHDAAAVAMLLEAEEHAPEIVRYTVKAQEIVRACLKRERKSRTPALRGLAKRMGVTY